MEEVDPKIFTYQPISLVGISFCQITCDSVVTCGQIQSWSVIAWSLVTFGKLLIVIWVVDFFKQRVLEQNQQGDYEQN